jgi:putative membrane protein
MTATQGQLAGLSRFIIRTPSWYASVTFALVVAALTGVVAFDATYFLEDAWQGLFFIGLPTVAAGLLTATIDQRLGGRLTHDRATLLALTCELLVVGVLVLAGLLVFVSSLGQPFVFDALIVALAAIFALRLLVIMTLSRRSVFLAVVPSSVQTVAAAVLLFVYSGAIEYFSFGGAVTRRVLARTDEAPAELAYSVVPIDFALLGAMCLLHGIAVWGFLTVIDIPWRRSLGVSVFDFVRGFLGHLTEGSHELETFFEQLGEEAVVPVTVCSIRRPNGTEKARFVLPMLHPGPMGDIGGGSLPIRIAEQANGLGFPPHATAGHDFNLVSDREVGTICDTALTAFNRIEYGTTASQSVRLAEGEATLTGQRIGDDALMVGTFAPACSDDVSYSVGLAARAAARGSGLDNVLVVDAHNCNDGLSGEDLGHVVPGSQRSFEFIGGAERLGDRLAGATSSELQVGVAWDETDWTPEDGIGPLGVRVAVFEVADQRTAYVLIDGNNMEPGLRERIVAGLDGVDRVEVMTSDTHVVNTVEAENQVGQNLPSDELLAMIDDLVTEAIADVEPVEAGMATESATVTVFGNDRTETLASHANAVVSMGPALAIAVVLGVLSMSVLLFLFASTFP